MIVFTGILYRRWITVVRGIYQHSSYSNSMCANVFDVKLKLVGFDDNTERKTSAVQQCNQNVPRPIIACYVGGVFLQS
jgi:hypothetical protein